MHELIKDIINRFGGRLAGSPQEFAAQKYLMELLEGFGATTEQQIFHAPLTARKHALKIFCIFFYTCLLLYWVDIRLALFLSIANAILFLAYFVTYHDWLDFLFPNQRSSNVIGTLEPQNEATSTIILSGHIDSTQEFIWWYYFKQTGLHLTIGAGLLFIFLPFFYLFAALFLLQSWDMPWGIDIVWSIFALLSPITVTFFWMHGKRVVPGAQDNLSGIVVAFDTLKAFADPAQNGKSILKNTRLRMASFGSEETGLRGSTAYARAFKKQLETENAIVLNMDGIMNTKELQIVETEVMSGTHYTPQLIKGLTAAFKACGVPFQSKKLLIGGTDAAPFIRNGLPAVSLLGLPTDRLDPTYHTRLDLPEYVEPAALENMKKVLMQFIQTWDS